MFEGLLQPGENSVDGEHGRGHKKLLLTIAIFYLFKTLQDESVRYKMS